MRVDFYQDTKLDEPRVVVQARSLSPEIEELMGMIAGFSASPLSGYSEGSVTRLFKDTVIRIYAKDKRVYADTADGTFLIKNTLYQLEEGLPDNFIRISNSEIVNVNRIIRLDMNLAGRIRMHMEGGIESYVSRRYVPKVKEALL